MKKTLFIISLLAILLSGCNKEDALNLLSTNFPTVTAGFEQNQTRTYVADENLLRWNGNDQISFFYGSTLNLQYKFDGEDGDNAGTFSIVNQVVGTGNELDCNYAVYPYSSTNKITESGVISACLPATQNYKLNSFGLGANTMVAATQDKNDTFLKFKNVGGYLKLLLFGDDVTVKTITLTGNSNEQIAGNATITTSNTNDPIVNMANDATEAITLDCGSGVKIGTSAETATAFWIVVPPTSFEDGFNVTIRDINGYEITKSTSNKINVERNRIKPMNAFEVEIIPDNQIWYTSSDGNIINFTSTNQLERFGAEISSNVYENGKGVVTFDGNVTTFGGNAFNDQSTLTSIILPKTVATIKQGAFQQCYNLEEIKIPNSVISIEELAFAQSGLRNITIPNGVISIGSGAFSGCSLLTSINISSSVTIIEQGAFAGCRAVTNITVDENNSTYDSRDNCNGIIKTSTNSLVTGCINTAIPASVTQIGAASFADCTLLTSITISENVTSIEPYAFEGCTSLANVIIKALIPPTMVFRNPFINCSGDLTIYVPAGSVDQYKAAAFWKDLNIQPINQ